MSESPSKFHLDGLDHATDQNLSFLCYIFVRHFVPTAINLQNRCYFSRVYQATEGERETGVEGQRRALGELQKPNALFVSRPSRHACLVLHVRLALSFARLKNANRLFCTLTELRPNNHSEGAVFKSCDNSYS